MTEANLSIKTLVTTIERDGKTYTTPTYVLDKQLEGINTYFKLETLPFYLSFTIGQKSFLNQYCFLA